ncbi:10256_t:CDS:1, partial [Acaulospora colombiana]
MVDVQDLEKPHNGFVEFCSTYDSILREKEPRINRRIVLQRSADMWKSIGEESRNSFKDLAEKKKKLYLMHFP